MSDCKKRAWQAVRNALGITMMVGVAACSGGGGTSSSAGTIDFGSGNSYTIDENSGTASFTLTRSGGSNGAVSVTCGTTDGTAVAGSDYTATSVTVSWADGDTADKTCDVAITDDSDVELSEDLTLTLSGDSLDTPVSKTITITDNDSVAISGVVSAPNGDIAFNGPGILQRMFAAVFGSPVQAGLSDIVSPVSGATVEVYRVDADGNTVGGPITTGTTDGNGTYTLAAPLDAPASQYIVRATGTSGTLDGRISDTSAAVDPATDATSKLVAEISTDLSTITVGEIQEIQDAVSELVTDIDTSSVTASTLSTALNTEAKTDEETKNVVYSTASGGQICGNVTDSSSNPLANIRIVARDFGNWVTRAKTKTDANGDYCFNVPVQGDTNPDGGTFTGEYIVGAFNRTGDSNDPGRHASEWWSTSGTAYNTFDAEKISVTSTTPVTGKDFQLEPGVRITGSVKAGDTQAAMEGVQVVIRDFDNRTVLVKARVKADGSYRVNVIPGKYLVVARNRTMKPYASEIYDGSTGTSNRNLGLPVDVTSMAGQIKTIDFDLESGAKLSGTITDGATGQPVTGMRVMINNSNPGGPADRLRTNKQGKYRIWLKPAVYKVYAYGQRNTNVDLTTGNQTVDFSATVSAISAILQDSGGNPVSQAKLRLYDTANTFLGFEISNSDGSVTMHTDQTGDHRVKFRIDRETGAGSSIYSGQTQLANATAVNVAAAGSNVSLGTITLPDGGILRGTVYAGNNGDTSTPIGNFSIEVRDGGTASTNRFIRLPTRGDGSYVLTLPAGTYERVKMRDATSGGNCDNIVITAGATTTLNYFDGDDTCG